MPLTVVTLLRDSSGAVKGSRGAVASEGGVGGNLKQQEIVVQWGRQMGETMGG